MKEIEIIHKATREEPYFIVIKPQNLHTCSLKDKEGDSLMSYLCQKYPKLLEVKGKKSWEYGAVHRLDFSTYGLCLIAQSLEFYKKIQREQEEGLFLKTYLATCKIKEGARRLPIKYKSYFCNYGVGAKKVRVVEEEERSKYIRKKCNFKKEYETDIRLVRREGARAVIEASLTRGARHQVRAHLSRLGYPIENDSLYNEECKNYTEKEKKDKKLALYAVSLSFINPASNKRVYYSIKERVLEKIIDIDRKDN